MERERLLKRGTCLIFDLGVGAYSGEGARIRASALNRENTLWVV